MTDLMLKELDRIESLSLISGSSISTVKSKSTPFGDSLDALLAQLQQAKHQVERGGLVTGVDVGGAVEHAKKQVDERQKELHGSLVKFGKLVDKKFPNPVPTSPNTFDSAEEIAALDRVVGMHFVRTGALEVADVFYKECGTNPENSMVEKFSELHRILSYLREGDVSPALRWAESHRDYLQSRHSTLEFDLHRSQFLRLVKASQSSSAMDIDNPPSATMDAIAYSRTHFAKLYAHYPTVLPQVQRLMASLAYMSKPSPLFADLLDPSIQTSLEPAFSKEYCANLHLSRDSPLKVVVEISANEALARIEKSKKIMKDKRSEWDVGDELMVEIPLPPENRYHSIFACPVSKEQATERNPPMKLGCGHVIAKESVERLTKSGKIKCPYCPIESSAPLRVYF